MHQAGGTYVDCYQKEKNCMVSSGTAKPPLSSASKRGFLFYLVNLACYCVGAELRWNLVKLGFAYYLPCFGAPPQLIMSAGIFFRKISI